MIPIKLEIRDGRLAFLAFLCMILGMVHITAEFCQVLIVVFQTCWAIAN
jgi:hypothetical protein